VARSEGRASSRSAAPLTPIGTRCSGPRRYPHSGEAMLPRIKCVRHGIPGATGFGRGEREPGRSSELGAPEGLAIVFWELGGPGPVVVKAAAAIQCKTAPSAGVGRWVGGSMVIGQAGSASPTAKFNAPVVLQIDRARAKTRKQDTTRPRNRSLPGADSQ
jgi:hypothetical protein